MSITKNKKQENHSTADFAVVMEADTTERTLERCYEAAGHLRDNHGFNENMTILSLEDSGWHPLVALAYKRLQSGRALIIVPDSLLHAVVRSLLGAKVHEIDEEFAENLVEGILRERTADLCEGIKKETTNPHRTQKD